MENSMSTSPTRLNGRLKRKISFRYFFHFFSHMNFRRAEECAVILRWLAPRSGEQILDIGCGDGYYDWRIAKSGAKVTGIDIHEKRLPVAQRFYKSERTQFLHMDAGEMNFPGESFDKVMSLCVIEHLPDDERVMQHISRVLKPGGYFLFSGDSLSTPGITPAERIRHQQRYAVNTFYTQEVVQEKLSRAGFEIEEWEYIIDSPFALALVRFSWKLDDLPKAFAPFRTLGYAAAGTLLKLVSFFSSRKTSQPEGGLTILVRARKTITGNTLDSIYCSAPQ